MKSKPSIGNLVATAAAAVAVVFATSCNSNISDNLPAPHLEKRGEVTQLIVKGEPWLALACELHNSSASSVAYMKEYWPKLKDAGLNTVLATVSWEQVEPEEGVFDFSVVDGIIADARKNDLKLVLLWFGSWKNGITSYEPKWVKKDTERFPLALTKEGKQLPILTTLCQNSWEADGKAYAALMKHIREVDASTQTVIMMQMENEVGLHGYTRDYSPLAEAAFAADVPQTLLEHYGKTEGGSWEEVFGKSDRTDEMFMAWNYASYMDKVSAAGKAEYDLPTFVNAWIVQPEDTRPGNYPSGGPQSQNHEIYRVAAPNIDILSPDIYLNDFPAIIKMYSENGNPVFIPESKSGQAGAANAAYAIGEMGAIGYSPFGFDGSVGSEMNATFSEFYKAAGSISGKILAAQAEGKIRGAWVTGADPAYYSQSVTLGDYKVNVELVSSGRRNGGAPQLTGGSYNAGSYGYAMILQEEDGYLVLGSNVRVTFFPAEGNSTVGLAKVTEGKFIDGKWVEGRWLNGDEIQLRYDLLYAVEEGLSGQGLNFGNPHPAFLKVELFNY